MSESLTPRTEFDYRLWLKQNKLVRSLKHLEFNYLKQEYNFDKVKEQVKPLDDLIKEHILLLKLLEDNKQWIKFAQIICEQSMHKVSVPHPVPYKPRMIERDYIEPTFSIYTGKDISNKLLTLRNNLEPLLKLI